MIHNNHIFKKGSQLILYLFHLFQTMNDPSALKIRVLKYVIPVVVISILFNVTKFFEIYLVWFEEEKTVNSTVDGVLFINQTVKEWKVALNVTEFRTNPIYSINFNWFRFIAIGVIPFLLLVYFNTQIYINIR